jgi:hypothetical protein
MPDRNHPVIARCNPAGIEFEHDAIMVEATIVADGLGLAATQVPTLIRSGEITSICERGVEDDERRYRLTFFHAGKRFRLVVDSEGRLIRRSTIDFGDRPLPLRLRKSEG